MALISQGSLMTKLGVVAVAGGIALADGPQLGTPGPGPLGPGNLVVDPDDEPNWELPTEIFVTGVVRDFREEHPDFEHRPEHGFGHYIGNVHPTLGLNEKPVFTGAGHKITSQWRDAQGRPVCYLLYDPTKGDTAGVLGQPDPGGITSAATFSQWFADTPGINLSSPLTLMLKLQEDGNYVFDDTLDEGYADLGGFFPIEDELFGNSGGSPDRNFHFTFELEMSFDYDADGNQFFKFIGDDDVFVFINHQLVIDLGGVHAAVEQNVDLNRLGLMDGQTYPIHFFFAERHRTQSNFRIETNLPLSSGTVFAVSKAFD